MSLSSEYSTCVQKQLAQKAKAEDVEQHYQGTMAVYGKGG